MRTLSLFRTSPHVTTEPSSNHPINVYRTQRPVLPMRTIRLFRTSPHVTTEPSSNQPINVYRTQRPVLPLRTIRLVGTSLHVTMEPSSTEPVKKNSRRMTKNPSTVTHQRLRNSLPNDDGAIFNRTHQRLEHHDDGASFHSRRDPRASYQNHSPSSYEETMEMSTLITKSIDHHNKGKSRVQASNTNRGAEAGAESNKQVTTRPRNCVQCRAYQLEVGKGECDGVRLESGDRGDIVLHSVET